MRDLHRAFEEDALASSHPLNVPEEEVQTSSAIIGMFDSITYSKVRSLTTHTIILNDQGTRGHNQYHKV